MKTCVMCATELSGRQARYCSKPCAIKGYGEARKADGRLRAQHAKHQAKRSAWMRENQKRYRGRYTRTDPCVGCQSPYTCAIDSDRTTCGDPMCRTFSRTGLWPVCKLPIATCDDCGATWINRAGGHSKRCAACVDATPRTRGFKWKFSSARRAAIYARDQFTCQLCSGPVDMDAHYLDDWAPSLDHIVPQSKGGTHADNNLRTAHRWCNSVRGDDTYYTTADLAA